MNGYFELLTHSVLNEDDGLRMHEISRFLSKKPIGLGKNIQDRDPWNRVEQLPNYKEVVKASEDLLKEPIPQLTDDVYLLYSRTGNRQVFDKIVHDRCYRVDTFTQAECIENKSRFLKPIEEILESICEQKTWVLTAHDPQLDNYYGRDITIDLHSSAISWRLAVADYILGDRLSKKLRKKMYLEIEQRTFKPFEAMLHGRREPFHWLHVTNNWNACCLAGVVGAALMLIESRERRAFYIMAFEKYIVNYFKGFTEDGYCSEGLAYWGYGFEHFLNIAELIYQATGGHVNYFEDEKIAKCALFGIRSCLMNGIYPSISDCRLGLKPGGRMMHFISKRYGLNLNEWENHSDVYHWNGRLYEIMTVLFMEERQEKRIHVVGKENLRSWFKEAGLLLCRPKENTENIMGVILKAGHNHEHHNHNDSGNFIVVVGESQLITDVGGEVYTSRTFSKRRYESNVLNSYGHSVPVIAGELQWPHISEEDTHVYKAKVLKIIFGKKYDKMMLDLTRLYGITELKKLTREFIYSRESKGSLKVIDRFEYTQKQSFETALITIYDYQIIKDNEIIISHNDNKIRILISSSDACTIRVDDIHEVLPVDVNVKRISVSFDHNVDKGRVMFSISPI